MKTSDFAQGGKAPRARHTILEELQRAAQSMAPVYAVFRDHVQTMSPVQVGSRAAVRR